MANLEKPIFVGTVSYLLSHRSYRDFIKGGLNVNQLPLLSDAVASLEASLEKIEPLELQHRGGSAAYSESASSDLRQYGFVEPFGIVLQDFYVRSVSFESGSVYAKIQIGAFVAFTAYQGIADYKDFKEGLADLKHDIVQIVNESFGVDGAGSVEGEQPQDDAEIRYYFVQPRRIEEEILRRRVEPPNQGQ
ncbi:hypothetical protein KBY31_21190 [Ruegeria pomeroyi]|nr:hypothetical protein [Ruegeria pomeroyi]